jgi:DNA-binding YbaB/EbfC family protein
MLGGLGQLAGLLKNARNIQERMAAFQADLAARRFTADSGAGAVKATVDGQFNLVDIKIERTATADVELLEDLIKAAVGAATSRAREAIKTELAQLTGGLNIPGLAEVLGKSES